MKQIDYSTMSFKRWDFRCLYNLTPPLSLCIYSIHICCVFAPFSTYRERSSGLEIIIFMYNNACGLNEKILRVCMFDFDVLFSPNRTHLGCSVEDVGL